MIADGHVFGEGIITLTAGQELIEININEMCAEICSCPYYMQLYLSTFRWQCSSVSMIMG